MPHISDNEKQQFVDNSQLHVAKEGQACFLFAKWADDMYAALPSWTTIHKIKRALRNPFHNVDTHQIIQQHMGTYDKEDILTAAELCFLEFYRLVGSKYEDVKRFENGSAFPKSENIVLELFSKALSPTSEVQVTEVKRGRGRPRKLTMVPEGLK